MKNAFEMEIPAIRDIIKIPAVQEYVRFSLARMFPEIDILSSQTDGTIDRIIESMKRPEQAEYESEAHQLLLDAGVKNISHNLVDRAKLIHAQIVEYVKGPKVCDIGCGDGRVSTRLIQGGFNVSLTDIYTNPRVAAMVELPGQSFPFVEYDNGAPLPFSDNEFDTTLALTVYHHCDDPTEMIRETRRITKPGGRVIVIESVYGLEEPRDPNFDAVLHPTQEYLFSQLSSEHQSFAGIILDHFYNRVIHFSDDPTTKVNVPYNFNTPGGWKSLFETNGLNQEKIIHLGIDQPLVPEYHTLHILWSE